MEANWNAQLMPKFNSNGALKGHDLFNEWLEFKAAYEIWAEAMEIHSQSKKFQWLLVAGGREIQRIYGSTPQSENEVLELKAPLIVIPQYDNAIYRLEYYFQSKSNPMLERQVLGEIKQQDKETFNEFVVRLRTQAMRCGFEKDRVDEEVFFQILQGAKSDKVKHYAVTESGKSLEHLISYAINDEIKLQQHQRKMMGGLQKDNGNNGSSENIQEQVINALKKWSKPKPFKVQTRYNTQKCNRCGSAKHYGGLRCPAMNSICHNCKKTGHFQRVCLMKRKQANAGSYKKEDNINQIECDDWDMELPKLPKVE